ncbi:MAG: hypothetical protein B5M53_01085 [Candidatus Cloacimonas sp. 4484_209]|nr:MAG: hypothetical protein B5M53_01085 [Candidatus Cloacimonas sp. 4484_209]
MTDQIRRSAVGIPSKVPSQAVCKFTCN